MPLTYSRGVVIAAISVVALRYALIETRIQSRKRGEDPSKSVTSASVLLQIIIFLVLTSMFKTELSPEDNTFIFWARIVNFALVIVWDIWAMINLREIRKTYKWLLISDILLCTSTSIAWEIL